jgi:O-6-methylguanine DNA methyltransferase
MIATTVLHTPIGPLSISVRGRAVCAMDFGVLASASPSTTSDHAAAALLAYFAGDLSATAALAVDPSGTDFQKRVWRALRELRAGETIAYGEFARALGRPGAARAVASANARNPIPIVVPCHRVIGADGSLTGYAGGLARKAWLLTHERGEHRDARIG